MRDNFGLSIINIQNIYNSQNELISQLRKQVEELKAKNYKDKELSRLKEENKVLSLENRHYGLHAKDYNALINWWNKHKKCHESENGGKNYNGYSFEIEEFPECICYSIKCSKCNEHHSIFY